MTGLSRKKGGRDGLIIPHLSYQDHIRIFTQSTSQRIRKASHIFTHFSLVNQRFLTLIFVLDRIFDRNNMPVAVLIHMFDHRRKCRGLSASGRSGHKNQLFHLCIHSLSSCTFFMISVDIFFLFQTFLIQSSLYTNICFSQLSGPLQYRSSSIYYVVPKPHN